MSMSYPQSGFDRDEQCDIINTDEGITSNSSKLWDKLNKTR